MKSILAIFYLIPFSLFGQVYDYTIDLQNVNQDKVKVVLKPSDFSEALNEFKFPKVIPGTYSKKNYGRFISDLKAFNSSGTEIRVKRKKKNTFVFSDPESLHSLEYWVEDTWDYEDKKDFVFQPGGSNIEAGKNFLLNNHAFFGYFEGYREVGFTVTVLKDSMMEGVTALKKKRMDKNRDILYAKDYNNLVDNPAMYSVPDTASFLIDRTEFVISNYSELGIVKAKTILEFVKPLGYALKKFLGELPVDRYVFLFYMADPKKQVAFGKKGLGGYGALEHQKSSVYFLPETGFRSLLKKQIQVIAAHEILHILTPLNIHSENIENFDFGDPEMSKHLWFYEGITEYLAMKVQVFDSLITEEQFLREMIKKMQRAESYSNYSFTKMSLKILKKKNQKRFLNVYDKGAIFGFLIDIYLIHLSDGKYDLADLMLELSNKYGPEKPFKDEDFFSVIEEMTYPHIGNFLKKYIGGSEKIPYSYYFNLVGLNYNEEDYQEINYFGQIFLRYDNDNQSYYLTTQGKNTIGIEDQDQLISINGITIDDYNAYPVYEKYFYENPKIEKLSIKVLRGEKEVTLEGIPIKNHLLIRHNITPDPDASTVQKELRHILYYR